jgi:PAS domain S-box-containing protein
MTELQDKTAKRKRTKEALRESEERYRDLLENAELAERVKELKCLYGISNLVHRTDISLGEMLQGTVDVIPPGWQYPEVICARITLDGREFRTENFRETVWRQTSDIIVNGERSGAVEVCYLEERRETDEGSFLPEKGDLINAIAERLGQIAERKQAEEALRDSEAKYRRIFESIQDVFYRTDAEGIIIEISPSMEQFGFTRDALIGTQVLEVYENPEERSALLKAIMERGEVTDYEIRLKAGDGRLINTSVSAHILRGPDGTLSGVEGTLRDISERKQAEDALRQRTYDLGQRVKEMNCLCSVSSLIHEEGFSLAETLQKMADLIPAALQYPEVACARITTDGQEFRTENWTETAWRQASDIIVNRERLGALEICYLEEKPQSGEGLFLREEDVLLHAVAEQIGKVIEHRRVEEELQRREKLFREILKVSRDLIYRLNLQTGEYDYATPSLLELYGFTGEELAALGRKRTDQRIHPRDRERVRLHLKSLLDQTAEDAVSPPVNYRFKCKDGTYRWFSANRSVARYEGGRPTAVVSCARDITDQRRSEEALCSRATELEDLNRQLVRAHDELAKSQSQLAERSMLLQRVVEVQILPLSESFEAVAREVLDLLSHLIPADIFAFAILDEREPLILTLAPARPSQQVRNEVLRRLVEAAELALGRRLAARTEIRFEPIASEAVNVENIRSHVLLPLTSSDLDTPILGGMFSRGERAFKDDDISLFSTVGVCAASLCVVRRNVEELRRATATLEQRNAELDAFTYSVSHDLKEPLRAIEAFSQFLLQDYSERLDDEGRDYLARMNKASLHLKQLIDDLLRLSRASRQAVGEERVEVQRLVSEVLEGMRATIDAASATVEVDGEMPDISGNPPWVEQVFSNLIGNAIKFSKDEPPVVKVGIKGIEGGMGTFYIQDNGIGIDPQYQKQIFGIFQRLHRREDYEGTGAGLAIVKRVVEALGGRVWVESEVGAGATFLFTLPLWTEVSASAQGEAA